MLTEHEAPYTPVRRVAISFGIVFIEMAENKRKYEMKKRTERHPAPDPAPWARISDPQRRLRTALRELYDFYALTEPMRGNVLRDAETMPELAALLEGSVVPYLEAVHDLLAKGWEVDDDRRKRLLATIKLAIDFHAWRSLERESGLSREEAVESMLEAVRSTVSRPDAR